MTGHTPGPWGVTGDAAHPMGRRVVGASRQIAKVYASAINVDDAEPNARLIAAAPDLLEALRDVIGWIPDAGPWATNEPRKALERARAALARATGETR